MANETLLKRRQRVGELASSGTRVPDISRTLVAEGYAASVSTVRRDLSAGVTIGKEPALKPVSEMIGRSDSVSYWRSSTLLYTLDATRTDYQWWDELRSCVQEGYEISGLFCQPICDILSGYEFGDDPIYSLSEPDISESRRDYTNQEIRLWVAEQLPQLISMRSESRALGDAFVFVNMDGSLTVPSPNTVKLLRDPTDPGKVVEAIVTTKFMGLVIETSYTAERRRRIIKRNPTPEEMDRGITVIKDDIQTFDNLIGVLPMVHFPCNRRPDELFGRPTYAFLRYALSVYNDLFMRSVEGVKLMGNPIPVFEGLDDVQGTIDNNPLFEGEETEPNEYYRRTGRDQIAVPSPTSLFVPKGVFNFKHPAIGFTADATTMLKRLFLMICDHTRIPEYLWGAAVEASKASTETQLPPFVQYINLQRTQLDGQPNKGGMFDLIQMVLRVKRLTDRRIMVGRIQSRYQDISREDEQIRLQKIIFARSNWALPKVQMLDLLHLVPDPIKTVALAEEELETQPQDDYMSQLNSVARREMNPEAEAENQRAQPVTAQNPAGGAQS